MLPDVFLALVLAYGPYRAQVLDVLAPDVYKLEVAVWPDSVRVVELHVDGINAPRLQSTCDSEHMLAEEALDFARDFVGQDIVLTGVRKSPGGIWYIGSIRGAGGRDLARALIDAGYAIPSKNADGHDPWCGVH